MSSVVNCFSCDSSMHLVTEMAEVVIGNRKARSEVHRYRCDECGETFYTPQQAAAAQQRAGEELRRQEGLLSTAEIKHIRCKFGLTQVQFEQLLGVGPKTVVRWERGTVFPNRSTDQLMRVIGAVPEAFWYLAGVNKVDIAPMSAAESQNDARVGIRMGKADSKAAKVLVMPTRDFDRPQQTRMNPQSDEVKVSQLPREALK